MTATLLIYVIVERLLELVIANRNTRRLLTRGAYEVGASHYPYMVGLHVAWLAAIVGWVAWTAPQLSPPPLVLYMILQGLRLWVIASLGPYWTTRIITLPEAPLVRSGPYRYLRHPNYFVVVLEIATLPLVFGAWHLAVIFSLLNAAVIWLRVSVESRALGRRF